MIRRDEIDVGSLNGQADELLAELGPEYGDRNEVVDHQKTGFR
jgi:hypothetical protein